MAPNNEPVHSDPLIADSRKAREFKAALDAQAEKYPELQKGYAVANRATNRAALANTQMLIFHEMWREKKALGPKAVTREHEKMLRILKIKAVTMDMTELGGTKEYVKGAPFVREEEKARGRELCRELGEEASALATYYAEGEGDGEASRAKEEESVNKNKDDLTSLAESTEIPDSASA